MFSPTSTSPPTLARWVLLCALACGIVAMHHVPAASGHDTMVAASAAVQAAPPMPDDGPCSPLHLCLAVLFAAVALLLVPVLLRVVRGAVVPRRRAEVTVARPPPVRTGRAVLATHCVLRI